MTDPTPGRPPLRAGGTGEPGTLTSRQHVDEAPAKVCIYGETQESLTAALAALGQPAYRARQVLAWLYQRRVTDWAAMSNLPSALRAELAAHYTWAPVRVVRTETAADATAKLLLEFADGALVETVVIRAPATRGPAAAERFTVCLSTQVGCAWGCRFCASGRDGLRRDLTAGEIVGQLLAAVGTLPAGAPGAPLPVDNLVFMGMGEPLANYDELLRAIKIINADWGLGLGARRITVSTAGLVPGIRRLAGEGLRLRLAISLHAATDALRSELMPINRRYPLAEVLAAAKEFSAQRGGMITLEYVLIAEVNDGPEQARALVPIALDLHAHVNCIPYNPVPGVPWERPARPRQEQFASLLRRGGVSVTLRREKGAEIEAACGQLRLRQLG